MSKLKQRCINIAPLEGNTVAPPLKLGEEYDIKTITNDSEGNEHWDVGLVSQYNYITSHETKEELPQGDKVHWCHPSRFEAITPTIEL